MKIDELKSELKENTNTLETYGKVKLCKDTYFRGIGCITNGEELGFEGCYNDDVNHPDPRPAHRIWIKPVHAEKLYKLFSNQALEQRNKEIINHLNKLEDDVDVLQKDYANMDYCDKDDVINLIEELKQQLTKEDHSHHTNCPLKEKEMSEEEKSYLFHETLKSAERDL